MSVLYSQYMKSLLIITVIRLLQISDFPFLKMTNMFMVSIMSAMQIGIL